ncbi:hypothetical protein ABZU94_11960 [Streptomyces mirabilis]|uniref:hypothetical protein n=1 Tax=Streptomyces sp. NPDC005388 TaxID=3156717 RepID=UPI0033B755DE
MTESTPSEPTPEEGEPTSFAETAKNWVKKHKTKIGAVVGLAVVGLAVVGVAARLAEGQADEDTEDTESALDPEAAGQPREPTVLHAVIDHLRTLPDGQNASEERRAAYKDATGEDLPAGQTYVSGTSRGGSSDEYEETPGEAAA